MLREIERDRAREGNREIGRQTEREGGEKRYLKKKNIITAS